MKDPKIEAGKLYKTRDGSKARVYATDGSGDFPIHGAVLFGGDCVFETWQSNGKVYRSEDSSSDIVSEWDEEESPIKEEEPTIYGPASGCFDKPEPDVKMSDDWRSRLTGITEKLGCQKAEDEDRQELRFKIVDIVVRTGHRLDSNVDAVKLSKQLYDFVKNG